MDMSAVELQAWWSQLAPESCVCHVFMYVESICINVSAASVAGTAWLVDGTVIGKSWCLKDGVQGQGAPHTCTGTSPAVVLVQLVPCC